MEPSEKKWESRAVLNPTVIKEKNTEHMFYRAVDKKKISSIGYARIENNKIERFDNPILSPTKKYEKKGIEDPRITKIKNKYYLLYTAFDGTDARIAYAVSKNLKDWEKQGIISPNISARQAQKIVKIKTYKDKWKHQEIIGSRVSLWDKDAVLFPEKINNKFVMLHRFMPDIQIVKFDSFSQLKEENFWRDYIKNLGEDEDKVSLYRRYEWEEEHIGAGATPIKTKKGWLLIYHGVESNEQDFFTKALSKTLYNVHGFLHKLRNKRLPLIYPLFSPKYDWEKQGDINNVIFPEGAVIDKKILKIYYGCSDSRIGLAEVNFKELIGKLSG